MTEQIDLRDPSLYRNRELSWLEFNRRVLHEALDDRTPLLERLKFLAIFAGNLDEFFQVRVAGVREQVAAGVAEATADLMTPAQQLDAIRDVARGMVAQQNACFIDVLVPALAGRGIVLHDRWEAVDRTEQERLSEWFSDQVFPVLTPLAVDPAHPFPHISNLSLSLAITLTENGGEPRFARVKVPAILPRWVPLGQPNHFIALEQVIGAHLDSLFPGVELLSWHPFRITRNTDMSLDTGQGDLDEADDLLELVQEEIRNRRFGEVVRIEVDSRMPHELRELLVEEFNADHVGEGLPLTVEDVFPIQAPLDATSLMSIASLPFPDLKDPPFAPATPLRLLGRENIFEAIRDGDILLHHPYDSFEASVEQLLAIASRDPDVLAIKITLYRTGGEITRLLAEAAERGKQVAVLIELQARFDEEQNISWARRFEDIGVHVAYGDAGMKTHAKVMLIVRREQDRIRRYAHIGTGNYNSRTARLYTDFGLLTCDEEIGADLSDLFNVLTGFAIPSGYRKLLVAPRWMKSRLIELIDREIEHVRAGRQGRIMAKMNALVDVDVIEALYRASRAGVRIDLVVRGICCLRPGVPGVSESIRIVSVLGRFLEHSRAAIFRNGGREEVYISSADWMPRNLDRRIEVALPIEDPRHRAEIRRVIEMMLDDNRQAWEMQPDGSYVQRRPEEKEVERASQRLLSEGRR